MIALAKSPIFNYGNEVYEFENYLLSRNFRGKNAYGRTWENNFKGNKELDFEKIDEACHFIPSGMNVSAGVFSVGSTVSTIH